MCEIWFNSSKSSFTPHQDFEYLRDIMNINKKLLKVTLNKCNLLWYFTSESIELALFDDSNDIKN